MTPYKNFLASTKTFMNSNGFLKFLLSAHIFVFAAGGLFFLLGLFILQVYEAFISLGSILIWTGLLLCVIKEDVLTIVITGGSIALGSLVAWIVALAGRTYYGISAGGTFLFTPFLFFLIFCAISIIVLLKAEKFKSMRASQSAPGLVCPGCGGFVPANSAFCPNCGAKRPEPQYAPPQYAQPIPPQYAPPQYAQPAPPQYAPPVPPQPAPVPPQPVPAPPVPPQPAAEPQPAPEESAVAEPAPETVKCVSCGAELPPGAVFCGKCGTKQG